MKKGMRSVSHFGRLRIIGKEKRAQDVRGTCVCEAGSIIVIYAYFFFLRSLPRLNSALFDASKAKKIHEACGRGERRKTFLGKQKSGKGVSRIPMFDFLNKEPSSLCKVQRTVRGIHEQIEYICEEKERDFSRVLYAFYRRFFCPFITMIMSSPLAPLDFM